MSTEQAVGYAFIGAIGVVVFGSMAFHYWNEYRKSIKPQNRFNKR